MLGYWLRDGISKKKISPGKHFIHILIHMDLEDRNLHQAKILKLGKIMNEKKEATGSGKRKWSRRLER